MTAQALIAEARSLGIALFADGDSIKARPAGRMSAELRARIAAEKPAVLTLLRNPAGPYVSDRRRCAGCGRSGFVVMVVTGCRDHLCRSCWASTTRLPDVDQPPTPSLDRWISERDANAERTGR